MHAFCSSMRALAITGLVAGGLLAHPAHAAEDILYIDVRTAAEFSSGAIEGAANIPHDEIAERIAEVAPEKDATIHVYCKSGGRSALAKKTLESLGYVAVTNAGGYQDLARRLSKQPESP